MNDIASNIEAMGFKTSISSTPEGYKKQTNVDEGSCGYGEDGGEVQGPLAGTGAGVYTQTEGDKGGEGGTGVAGERGGMGGVSLGESWL